MKKTRGHGDAGKEGHCATHPRVAPSPRPRVFFVILHPSSLRIPTAFGTTYRKVLTYIHWASQRIQGGERLMRDILTRGIWLENVRAFQQF